MAPLSKELSELILPHDHFGTHRDNSGRTTDFELERINFEYAGKTLAVFWSNVVVDKFPCVAEYVGPSISEVLQSDMNKNKIRNGSTLMFEPANTLLKY